MTIAEAEAAGHIARLHQEEPDNNTVVFLNADGTRTSYAYGVPVKYTDENGNVKDKNNTIKAFNNEYGNTAGDVEFKFPKKLNKIKIQYKNHNVQLAPVTDVSPGKVPGVVSGNTITYPGAFGEGMDLRYASTMSGIKEDIILDSYRGVNTFCFELKTNGLTLQEVDGQYCVTDGETVVFNFGDLEVTDSFTGKDEATDDWDAHRTIADIEVITVKENTSYLIILTVDENYLTNPETVYPVYVDPSFNVTSTYIQDTYIAKGYAANNYVNSSLTAVGYGTNSHNIRTLAKITNLKGGNSLGSAYTQANVNSAYYSMYCKSNYTSSPTVDVYRVGTTVIWNPSTITWTNGNITTMSGATKISSLPVKGQGRYNFDNLSAYRLWDTNSMYINNGLLFRMTTEVAGKYREFSSANVSDSTKLPYVVVVYNEPESVTLSHSAIILQVGQTKTLTATVSPSTAIVFSSTWTSSNTNVATVSDNGVVTAKGAGTATITCLRRGLNTSASATCAVTVTGTETSGPIANGTYVLNNNYSGRFLSVPGSAVDGLVICQSSYDTASWFMQQWNLTWLGNGYYVIRPVNSSTLALDANVLSAKLKNIGSTNTASAVPESAQWQITALGGAYIIRPRTYSAQYIAPITNSKDNGVQVVRQTSTSVETRHRWTLVSAPQYVRTTSILNVPAALYFTRTGSYSINAVGGRQTPPSSAISSIYPAILT